MRVPSTLTFLGLASAAAVVVNGAPALAPAADEVVQMIHAQSLSEMKHDDAAAAVVPVQRLGLDGLPPKYNQHLAAAGVSSSSYFNPINLVPVPPTRQQRQDVTGNSGRHSSGGAGNIVAMDDFGRVKEIDLPVTAAAPAPAPAPSVLSVSSNAGTAHSAAAHPPTVSPWMAVAPPHNGRKHVLGLQDNGLLHTLHVPVTASAPSPSSKV